MRTVLRVNKINALYLIAKKQLENSNYSLEDIMNDEEAIKIINNKLGIDIRLLLTNIPETQSILLDIDKILAIDEPGPILGLDNKRGFTVWFDTNANNCWYLSEEDYASVSSTFENRYN